MNRKTLEIVTSLPREWQVHEPEIVAQIKERVSRGRVHVAMEILGPRAIGLQWDDATVDAVLTRLAETARRREIRFEPTPELLFQIAYASRSDGVAVDPEQARSLVLSALDTALSEIVAMRAREGAALAQDVVARAARLAEHVQAIEGLSAKTVANHREGLLARLRQAGLDIDLDDERVLKEIALFADRIDVSEELTRLRSHLNHLAQLAESTEPVGRKAEFLLQEISREVHTVGSKANDLDVARVVIEMKNELERIREQIQNVE